MFAAVQKKITGRSGVMHDSMRAPRGVVCRLAAAALFGSLALFAAVPALAEPLRVELTDKKDKKYPQIDEAREKLMRMDVDGALESLKAASRENPELSKPRVLLAGMFFSAQRVREGRAQLERAVVEEPSDPEPYLLFGDLAFREGQLTDAGLLYDKALALAQALKDGDAEKRKGFLKRAYTGVELVAEGQERWADAQKNLAALLAIDSELASAHYRLGRVLFELQKPKEAYAELQAASRMDDKVPSPETTMARLYDKAKDRARAEEWMKRAVANDPQGARTRTDVALWYMEIGRIEEAKAAIEEALKLDAESQQALFLAGRISRFAHDFPAAMKHLERAYLQQPGNAQVANELALVLIEGEEALKQRLALAETTMKQHQNNPEAAATLGWIYYRTGRLDEAERYLNMAASAMGVSPDTAYFYARLADARNRTDTAKQLIEIALKSEAPFAYREDAQRLQEQLAKRPATAVPGLPAAPIAPPADSAPVGPPPTGSP